MIDIDRHPDVIPAAASRGIQHLIEAPEQQGVLLGLSAHAAWLQIATHVLIVEWSEAVRFPNGVSVDDPLKPRVGERCSVGEGRIQIGEARAGVTHWWDPRPLLTATTCEQLGERSAEARVSFGEADDRGLGEALAAGSSAAVRHAAWALLGRGEGLTPEGDDLLVGLLAGLRLLGPVLGDAGAGGLLASLAPAVLSGAPARTTALSAALLRHAVAGEVAGPLADLLRALTGEGSLDRAVEALQRMGASSGEANARGVLLVAGVLCGRG